jgi:putative membrane protein insertion efficiency factor
MKSLMQLLLRWYKQLISPLLPPAWRYVPTCSEYAADALEHYGLLRGGAKAVLRLLRCHPLARGGYDPAINHTSQDAVSGS